jgi:hypothetical protein
MKHRRPFSATEKMQIFNPSALRLPSSSGPRSPWHNRLLHCEFPALLPGLVIGRAIDLEKLVRAEKIEI